MHILRTIATRPLLPIGWMLSTLQCIYSHLSGTSTLNQLIWILVGDEVKLSQFLVVFFSFFSSGTQTVRRSNWNISSSSCSFLFYRHGFHTHSHTLLNVKERARFHCDRLKRLQRPINMPPPSALQMHPGRWQLQPQAATLQIYSLL